MSLIRKTGPAVHSKEKTTNATVQSKDRKTDATVNSKYRKTDATVQSKDIKQMQMYKIKSLFHALRNTGYMVVALYI